MTDNLNKSLQKGLKLLTLGRIKQWNKWGPERKLEVLDHKNVTILAEELGEVSREVIEHRKMLLLAELIDLASFAEAWMEAIIEWYEYEGYSFEEIEKLVENEFELSSQKETSNNDTKEFSFPPTYTDILRIMEYSPTPAPKCAIGDRAFNSSKQEV